jgi:putative oxidoreductase
VQRLYSTFATGLPGVGLLLMRLVAGIVLVARGVQGLHGVLTFASSLQLARILLGQLAITGLWTPLVGVLVAVLEVGVLVRDLGTPWLNVLLATLGVCLALLGPGAWSVDARLFGWRRINIDNRD